MNRPHSFLLQAAEIIAECRLLATMTEEPGRITRRFLTSPVAHVHAHLRRRMEALGMTVTVDAIGNLRGLWQPPQTEDQPSANKRLLIGSHIDTVPNAGAFDGVLGVVLALYLVELARQTALPLAIEVLAFSEEEGIRFHTPYLGSRAVAGRFDPALLSLRDSNDISMEEAIRGFGLDPNGLDQAAVSGGSIAFLELHIEQGPFLDAEGLSLAVVTAIAGQTRCEVAFTGAANHAGTTPMHLRQDALAAAAEWISAVESTARENSSPGADAGLVATVGRLLVEPNAPNVIAGATTLSLDVRSPHDSVREQTVARLLNQAGTIAARRGLQCQAHRQLNEPAVPMDDKLTALLEASVAEAGFPVRRLPSGAGHDAQIMAQRMPAAMLFLRSPAGISHHPAEAVYEQDVAAALHAGTIFLRKLIGIFVTQSK